MANRKIEDSIKIREIIKDAVEIRKILTVSEIVDFVDSRGYTITQATVNKILRQMGYEPQLKYEWAKKEVQ